MPAYVSRCHWPHRRHWRNWRHRCPPISTIWRINYVPMNDYIRSMPRHIAVQVLKVGVHVLNSSKCFARIGSFGLTGATGRTGSTGATGSTGDFALRCVLNLFIAPKIVLSQVTSPFQLLVPNCVSIVLLHLFCSMPSK